jgi:hypothetical protein
MELRPREAEAGPGDAGAGKAAPFPYPLFFSLPVADCSMLDREIPTRRHGSVRIRVAIQFCDSYYLNVLSRSCLNYYLNDACMICTSSNYGFRWLVPLTCFCPSD